jgi:EmrB/QacA subfamily drug resistance transporter
VDEQKRVSGKWWTLGAVCVAIFMLLLDTTIVNVALPDIQRSLGSSFSDLQWVVDAYALGLAALLLTSGSLADLLGRRRVFTAGLVLFTLASLACGLAGSPLMLNVCRAIQGIGGSAMLATSLALLAQAFHGRERGTAFGIFGATIGGAVAIGPLLGGALTDGIGWEWIFFVNIPVGIAAVFVSLTRVDESRDPRGAAIDWPGLVTFSAALFMLVFALVRGNAEGWGSTPIVALLVGSAVLLVAFVLIERSRERPMLDLHLFRNPTFVGASAVAFAQSAAMFAMFLYLMLYIQNVLGYEPFDAGLRFLPFTLLSFFVAPVAGRLAVRIPVRLLLGTGLTLVGLGLLWMSTVDVDSDWTVLLGGFVMAGLGVGMVNAPLTQVAVGVVSPERSGMASGINNTFRQVGLATGIAGLGAVFQHEVVGRTTDALATSRPGRAVLDGLAGHVDHEALANGSTGGLLARVPAGARESVSHALRVGFTGALSEILVIGAIVALIGGALGYALVRRRDMVASGPQVAEAPAVA